MRELLTGFGKTDIMWFDFSFPKSDGGGKGRADRQSEKLYAMVRELAPVLILNDRSDLTYAQLLSDASEVRMRSMDDDRGDHAPGERQGRESGRTLLLELPVQRPAGRSR